MNPSRSPRIAYWTSAFRAQDEALAGEVACLRNAFPGSVAWGVSRRDWRHFSWQNGYCIHPRLHLAFRAATGLMQRAFEINHLFGGLGDWFHLVSLRKSPNVMTVAVDSPPCSADLLHRIEQFAIEWPGASETLRKLGICSSRIRYIPPGVDITRFSPAPSPAAPFTVLFASSPDRADWLDARGVGLLIEVAEMLPEFRFRLLWRSWGNSLDELRRRINNRELNNIDVVVGQVGNMAMEFRHVHCTVAPFVDIQRCKPAPNSVIESLACGRPVVLTDCVGLADIVEEEGGGVVCSASAASLENALRVVEGDWRQLAERARSLAEQRFDQREFVAAYGRLYNQLL